MRFLMHSPMESWGWGWHPPSSPRPLNMLALRLEQGSRGGGETDHLQKGTNMAWQGCQSGRSPSQRQGINIKEKISQWEGRSQQGSSQDVAVKAHPPAVSRSLSGDVLGNGELRGGLHPKASLSNAKSLDFREGLLKAEHVAVGRKSEPLLKCSTEFLTSTPGNKPLTAQRFTPPKVEANTAKSTGEQIRAACDSQKTEHIFVVDVVSKPLPRSADDQEDNMPAGNFYTSRGFWRKLEGDRLLWEKGRDSSGEAQPPPKPQRTFQYRGANNATLQVQCCPQRNHSNMRSRRVAHPPSFPPPPCPGAKTNGLSRHKKNR